MEVAEIVAMANALSAIILQLLNSIRETDAEIGLLLARYEDAHAAAMAPTVAGEAHVSVGERLRCGLLLRDGRRRERDDQQQDHREQCTDPSVRTGRHDPPLRL